MAGNRFIRQCDTAFGRLSRFPRSGTRVRYEHTALQGCRFILVPQFEKILIFYRPHADRIEIIRILHGARDIEGALDLKVEAES